MPLEGVTGESLDGLKRVLEGDLRTFAGGGSVVGGRWAIRDAALGLGYWAGVACMGKGLLRNEVGDVRCDEREVR